MRNPWLCPAALLALLSGCSSESGLPGSYITTDDGSGYMLQLTSVKDHAVSGTLTVVVPEGHGQIHASSRPFSGTIEGQSLNLAVEKGNTVNVITGTVVPDGLDLTFFANGGSERLTFPKRKADDFTAIETAIRLKAANEHQADLQVAQQGEIDRETASLQTKSKSLDEMIVALGSYPAALRTDLETAISLKRRQASITRDGGQGSVAIEQIAVARQQHAMTVESGQTQLASTAEQMGRMYRADTNAIGAQQARCTSNPQLSCAALDAASNQYTARMGEYSVAMKRAAALYQDARRQF